jgi:hypothetical protein
MRNPTWFRTRREVTHVPSGLRSGPLTLVEFHLRYLKLQQQLVLLGERCLKGGHLLDGELNHFTTRYLPLRRLLSPHHDPPSQGETNEGIQ